MHAPVDAAGSLLSVIVWTSEDLTLLQEAQGALARENFLSYRCGDSRMWPTTRCSSGMTSFPDGPRRSSQKPGVPKNRALRITEAAKSCPKAHRVSRRRCDMVVS